MSRARDVADVQDNAGGAVPPFVAGKNKILNSDMTINQRNAITTINSGLTVYTLDRFAAFAPSGLGAFTVEQSSDVPATATANKSMLVTCTTAEASLAASSQYQVEQRLEYGTLAPLMFGKASALNITISFWVKSSLTGTYCLSLRNSVPNRSYVAEYTINSANTWEKKTITLLADTAGTWDAGAPNGLALRLTWILAAGSNTNTTANAWATENKVSTANQVNFVSSATARTWQITQIQLEAGTVATPFTTATGTIQGELAACQRYYWRLSSNGSALFLALGEASSTTQARAIIPFPVQMRVAPSLSASANTTFTCYQQYAGKGNATISLANAFLTEADVAAAPASALTAGAPAFIGAQTSSAFIDFSSEL